MSYLNNSRGLNESNPINDVTTVYTKDNNMEAKEYQFDTPFSQNMFVQEPISGKDTEYYNSYRQTTEQLRSRTESMNAALEAALVPSIVKGASIRTRSTYKFVDRLFRVDEFNYKTTFNCNMVLFKSNRFKKLCYNGTIHTVSKEGDTLNSIKEYFDSLSLIGECNPFIAVDPLHAHDKDSELDVGIDIDTGIPSSLYNLYKLNYIQGCLFFINGRAISWTKTIVTWDTVDTYITFDLRNHSLWNDKEFWNNAEVIYMDIPFVIDYCPSTTDNISSDTPIFCFDASTGFVHSDEWYKANINIQTDTERIFCKDPNIIYEEFRMDENPYQDGTTTKFGTYFNKRFTDYEYRYKLKRFNLLCFEDAEFDSDNLEWGNGELRDDFDVESHQFNFLRISIDSILNKPRRFKIFYNTRVKYDQDNMLRIKNRSKLEEQFAAYMRDVTSNVQTFIKEIYALMVKDIGIYIDPSTRDEYSYNTDDNVFSCGSKIIPVNKDILKSENKIIPDSDILIPKYPKAKHDYLKLRTEICHFANMSEGSTPNDQFIYYENPETTTFLREIAHQIFEKDSEVVQKTIDDLILRAYIEEYNKTDPKSNASYRSEWFIRKNLHEMFLYSLDDYLLDDMSKLDEVFDFTYSDTKSYEENLKHGVNYIIGYDADKLESCIRRNTISRSFSGSQIKANIIPIEKEDPISQETIQIDTLVLPVWRITKLNNSVMIFINGTLAPNQGDIYYDGINFYYPVESSSISDSDNWELVFFLNTNNNVYPVSYINQNIPCNTSVIDPENLQILINKIPNGKYNDYINFDESFTEYPIDDYKILSYKTLLKTSSTGNIVYREIVEDEKINGLYRVTKEGDQGEYFIKPTIEGTDTEPLSLTLCSRRQFRYASFFYEDMESNKSFILPEEFKYCTNSKQVMVFVNGYIISNTFVYSHSIDGTPLDSPKIWINSDLKEGDKIEVFYIPEVLNFMNSQIINTEKLPKVFKRSYIIDSATRPLVDNNGRLLTHISNDRLDLAEIDDICGTGYIRFKSPLYGSSSKHSVFIFLNGKKIPFNELEDISDTIIKVMTNQSSCIRLEVYSFVDPETYLNAAIKDGLSHENEKIKTFRLSDLESYSEPSKLDKLINPSTDQELNILFENDASVDTSDIQDTTKFPTYLSKDKILERLKISYAIAEDPGDWIALVE